MKKPEMILFDYGHTLLCEPGFDARRCEEAAFPYIVKNPQNLTAEQIYAKCNQNRLSPRCSSSLCGFKKREITA